MTIWLRASQSCSNGVSSETEEKKIDFQIQISLWLDRSRIVLPRSPPRAASSTPWLVRKYVM